MRQNTKIGYVLLTIGYITLYNGYPSYALLTLVPSLFLFGSDLKDMYFESKLKKVRVESEDNKRG